MTNRRSQKRISRTRTGALLASLTLLLAACSSGGEVGEGGPDDSTGPADWQSVVEAAAKEGEVVLYTSQNQHWIDPTVEVFQKETGLLLSYPPRAATGIMLERFAAEKQAGAPVADLLHVVDRNVWSAEPDWFIDLSEAGIPNYDSYPDGHHLDNRCVFTDYGTAGFVYNTDEVPESEAPETWEDLLDPRYKGRMIFSSPKASPSYMAWAFAMEKEFGIEFLEALAEQEFDVTDSATPAAEQVAAGAYAISVLSFLGNSSGIRKAGAPIKHVIPDAPAFDMGQCVGISADAPNPNAAKVLLNFLLSPEAQAAGCSIEALSRTPLNVGECIPMGKDWERTSTEKVGHPDEEARVLEALGIGG